MNDSQPILQIEDLHQHFPLPRGVWGTIARRPPQVVRAVDGITLTVHRGEILALVGESGSGKTTVGMNVLGLQTPTSGRVLFDGHNVAEWARGRGPEARKGARASVLALRRQVQMVFQDPYEALNPRQRVFDIVAEPLEIHGLARDREEKVERVRAALESCGLAPAEHFWQRLPAGLSGGQRQRLVIASALVLEPLLLVADEPVSMLDVSIRAEILGLLRALRAERGITILYTTHDLATAGYFTDRMAVMYLGRIVELGPTAEVLSSPRHPYTRALLSVAPAPNPRRRRARLVLQGEIPNPTDVPRGCRFHPRCPLAVAGCQENDPVFRPVAPGHEVACHLA